jgi:hypothetical protein
MIECSSATAGSRPRAALSRMTLSCLHPWSGVPPATSEIMLTCIVAHTAAVHAFGVPECTLTAMRWQHGGTRCSGNCVHA